MDTIFQKLLNAFFPCETSTDLCDMYFWEPQKLQRIQGLNSVTIFSIERLFLSRIFVGEYFKGV